MDKEYWISLDGLRAVAVMIVLAGHAELSFPRSGGVGVDVFFVLSGFLITSILSAEAQRFGRIGLRNFYIRRALRLMPCLLLTCGLFALWSVIIEGHFPGQELAYSLTYTSNWARALYDAKLSGLTHTWSLSAEEQYYLLWPWVIVGLERLYSRPLAKGAALLSLAAALALYRYGMVGTYSAPRIYFGLDTHMDGLVLGSALSYGVRALGGEVSGSGSRLLGRVLAPASVATLLAIIYSITWRSPWMGRVGYALAAGASALIILDLVAGRHSIIKKPLSLKPLVFIGKISYGIYLIHFPVYHAIEHLMPDARPLIGLPLKASLSIAAASLSYFLLERRFLSLKGRFRAGGPQSVSTPD